MKFSEMRELTIEDLHAKIETLHKELFEARFKQATHQLEDTAVFRRKRHEIAQLNTVLSEKQRAAATTPAAGKKSKGEKTHA
jgi:large subunit ribosomal protein L29